MGETTDQIEKHIEIKRAELQSNLRELAQRVKSATDWRQQFRNHTALLMAAAFGGGMLLSVLVDSLGKDRRGGSSPSQSEATGPS
jgi:hypothetical protein